MHRLRTLALVALLGSLLLACGSERGLRLTSWQLSVLGANGESAAATPVTLPAQLQIPDHRLTYELRTTVAVPPEMRAGPLSLTVTELAGIARLTVDGEPAVRCDAPFLEVYRSSDGAACWHVPVSATRSPERSFVLSIDHRAAVTGRVGLPLLSATPYGDAAFRFTRTANAWITAAAFFAAFIVGCIYLVLFLSDRSVRSHGWFVVQGFGILPYELYRVGVLQWAAGTADALFLVSASGALVGSVHFMHAELGLGRPSRVFLAAWGASIVVALLWPSPFHPLPLAAFGAVFASSTQVYILARSAMAARDPKRRLAAATFFFSWLVLALTSWTDFEELLLGPMHAGGLRLFGVGVAVIAIAQAILLGINHSRSLRAATDLNEELRHQIAQRSRQLAEALAAVGSAPHVALSLGDVVNGRYRILEELGAGGMGRVFLVERTTDGRRFALKALLSAGTGPALARLAREAQIAAEVSHPALVSIVDIDVATSGWLFLVMELVDGGSLADAEARYGDMEWGLAVLGQIASGLVVLHERGVVHRDLKPGNVLLAKTGSGAPVAKITDFGISSLRDSVALDDTVAAMSGAPVDSTLTRTGMILGTPTYMAPELAAGSKNASPATDMFALGILANQLLAATYPFAAVPILERLAGRAPLPAAPLGSRAPQIDAALAALVDAALSFDASERPSARAFSLAVERALARAA